MNIRLDGFERYCIFWQVVVSVFEGGSRFGVLNHDVPTSSSLDPHGVRGHGFTSIDA
jgi:hypothetical protein